MNRTVIASVLSLHYLGYMCTAPHIVGDVASVFFGKILYINDGRRVKQSSESEGTELRLFFGALRASGRIPFVILNYTCLRFLIYTPRRCSTLPSTPRLQKFGKYCAEASVEVS